MNSGKSAGKSEQRLTNCRTVEDTKMSNPSRTPFIKRTSIYNRTPIFVPKVDYEGCIICDKSCNGTKYCEVRIPKDEDSDSFRLIRILDVSYSQDEWDEIVKTIEFVKSQECNVRVVTDRSLPNEVLYKLSYSSFNVVQFNLNLMSHHNMSKMKRNIFLADNCGLYISLMLFPIIPTVTKSSDILELLSSMRCSCNTVCFKFVELSANQYILQDHYIINGYSVHKSFMSTCGDRLICSEWFKTSFCTIFTQFLEPRKINCSLCNDNTCY